jgi:hypothetical protein
MSNPSKSERYTASQPDAMRLKSQITGVFSEMPRGDMAAGFSTEMDTSETQMPAGNMNGGGDTTTGDMPSGKMTEAAAAGSTTTGSSSSHMTGLTESEMPRGQMTNAQSGTDNGLTVTDMPSGYIQALAQAVEKTTDVFPVLEISGEWLLTLSPTSLKKSRGN